MRNALSVTVFWRVLAHFSRVLTHSVLHGKAKLRSTDENLLDATIEKGDEHTIQIIDGPTASMMSLELSFL